jgi:hypothetical protein
MECTILKCYNELTRCTLCGIIDSRHCLVHSTIVRQIDMEIMCKECITKFTCVECKYYPRTCVTCTFCHNKSNKCKKHSHYIDFVGSFANAICCISCALKYVCPKCLKIGHETIECCECKKKFCYECHEPSEWKNIKFNTGLSKKKITQEVKYLCIYCQRRKNLYLD